MLGNYKSGMVVQTTTTVATITPENSQRYLEAYVSTSDMARMHEGDRVQAVMDGLPQNVYGTIYKRKRITDRQQCHYTGRAGWSDKPGV